MVSLQQHTPLGLFAWSLKFDSDAPLTFSQVARWCDMLKHEMLVKALFEGQMNTQVKGIICKKLNLKYCILMRWCGWSGRYRQTLRFLGFDFVPTAFSYTTPCDPIVYYYLKYETWTKIIWIISWNSQKQPNDDSFFSFPFRRHCCNFSCGSSHTHTHTHAEGIFIAWPYKCSFEPQCITCYDDWLLLCLWRYVLRVTSFCYLSVQPPTAMLNARGH